MSERDEEKLDRTTQIFEQAIGMARDERATYLARVCGENTDLKSEIESMLAAHFARGAFLEDPTISASSRGAVAFEGTGSVIGRYKLLQRIGHGGFGVVYMAEQREPIKRKVALKIIKLGMDTQQVIARFEAERQALAIMDHPSIARVLDAGATESGRPYFVMELVKGVPITRYCDTQNLTTGARLDLFIDVCSAVQHAHQKGIIHRDLKPSNVMVTLHDGRPVPKVIDFGIAKATNAELTEKTLFTEFRQMIGTPTYMSPEQAEMSGLDLDTRSDIYSLGVLLYELLTGSVPFDTQRLCTAGIGEIQRIIREEEPPRPSAKVSGLSRIDGTTGESSKRTSAEYVSRHRQTDLQGLVRRLRGDLDWIVMRALEKDRTRRYETAVAFGEDIRRHRANEPVIARPPSAAYWMHKFVRRNRWGVIAAGLIALALLGGLTMATVGLVEARRAQAQVTVEAERTRAVANFYAGVFSSVNPMRSGPEGPPATQVTLVNVLHAASDRATAAFEGQPVLEAEVRKTLGASFFGLGSREQAMAQSERALALETEALGADHPTTLQTALMVGASHWANGNYLEAERRIRPRIDRAEDVLGENNPLLLRSLCLLTNCLTNLGRLEEAERFARDGAERTGRVLGEDHPISVGVQVDLARVLLERGRFEESKALMSDLMQRLEAGQAQAAPMVGPLKRFEEAESHLLRAQEAETEMRGAQNHRTRLGAPALHELYTAWGKSEAAAKWAADS